MTRKHLPTLAGALVAAAGLSWITYCHAIEAPWDVESLRKAELIVTGQVQRAFTREVQTGSYIRTTHALEIAVRRVEKGQQRALGSLVYVRCSTGRPAPGAEPVSCGSGQHRVPKEGDCVRVYIRPRQNGGLDVYGPNGFEKLEPFPKGWKVPSRKDLRDPSGKPESSADGASAVSR